MAQAPQDPSDVTDRFIQFYRKYYRDEIGTLAQQYPNEQRSLYVHYDDLSTFDIELAEDYLAKPDQMQEYAEEALRLYDLPADVKLGRAHVRLTGLPETVDIRDIRVHDDHIGRLIAVQGIVRKATDVRPKITEAAFECQRCGTMTYIPQSDSGFQEPHECQGCERQGPFHVDFDQSEFVDAQKVRVQESPEGLRGGETPQNIDVDLEDDVTGRVTAGDHVTLTGVLHIEQQTSNNEKTPIFDLYMDGVAVEIEDEEFEDMNITEADVAEIVDLSNEPDIHEMMVDSVAPSIYGYREEKLAMILQLFSGVTKHLPDGSRIRGDLHMLLIGDPGTGKCVAGDTLVTLADGSEVPIRELVEENLDDPKPVDDGVWDTVDLDVPSMESDGSLTTQRATKVWKREAPEKLYRIRTASGREIEVTPSHPLFVQSSGEPTAKRAKELDEGQFVATPRSLPVDGDDSLDVGYRRSKSHNAVSLELPEEWTPSLARLVGYIVAEGYVESRDDHTGSVRVTNNDEEILSDTASAFDALGLNYSTYGPREGKSAKTTRCSSGEFVSFLERLEPSILDPSADQQVPDAIHRATIETKGEFLRAYIDAEGHVSAVERELTVASMSRELLEGVRSLLLSFDISSSMHPRQDGSYRLRVSGKAFQRYVKTVGFVTERKTASAQAILESNANTNVDVIPGVGDTLKRTRESLALSQEQCGIPRTTYQHYERGDRNPSRDSLESVVSSFEDRIERLEKAKQELENASWDEIRAIREILNISQADLASDMSVEQPTVSYYERTDAIPDGGQVSLGREAIRDRLNEALSAAPEINRLRSLVDNDVLWDRIESIESIAPNSEWVYDLEVAGTHSYLSNNFVSHNSAMLQYIRNIAPRSVYTSGKGSSSAGLCVTGDTRIHTANGFVPIRDLATKAHPDPVSTETSATYERDLYTFDREDGTVATAASSHAWRMPEKACRRIETGRGKHLEASVNTPVLTCGEDGIEWKPIRDVEAGDYVAAPKYDGIDRSAVPTDEFIDYTEEKLRLTDESIEFLREQLTETYGSLRDAAAALTFPEDFIYDTLSNRYVPIEKLDRILDAVGASHNDITVRRAMLAHGDDVRIPRQFDEDLLYLVGLVFGDGDIALDRRDGNRGMVRISNSNEALLERAAEIIESTFDKRVEIERQEDRVPCIRLHSGTIARFFSNLGMASPKESLELDPRLTAAEHADAFLRGLMDADGSVSSRTDGGSSIQFSTISESLAEQVQLILETYGVESRRRARDRRGTTTLASGYTIESKSVQHHLAIYGRNIDQYAEVIGFESADKRVALSTIVGATDRRDEKIPIGGALATAEVGGGGQYYMNVTRGDNPGRERAHELLDSLDFGDAQPTLEEAVDADLTWDEVVEAVDTGDKEVYDLTVPGTHNFLGNGVVTHNTAAAVRDDFGDGQQWTLEAGALVLADKGIAAVDELDKMRCVTGDTLVALGDGSRSRIDQLAAEAESEGTVENLSNGRTIRGADIDVWTMAGDERLVRRPVTAIHEYDAPDTLYTVTLSDGSELTTTADHPFFVCEDGERAERSAEAIDPGDEVYVPTDDRSVLPDGGVRPDSTPIVSDIATAEPHDPVEQDVTTRTVDSVRRVASDPEACVYDLTVQGTHNFVANGMVVHNSEDRSAMHEALEQQSYHPDSEILLSDGRRVEIGPFVDSMMDARADEVVDGVNCEILPVDDVGVHTVDLDENEVEKVPVDRVSRHEAPEEFVRVSFSNGRSVTVTPEHPMFVDDGGEVGTVDAVDLSEGEYVPAPRKLPNSAVPVSLEDEARRGKERDIDLPTEMSPDLAEILGLLTAEGHSSSGGRTHEIGFSNQDERLLDRTGRLMNDVFGLDSTDAINTAGTTTKRWVSTKLYRWFESNFPGVMRKSSEKRIPGAVLGASEEEIRRFLVGAFAGDSEALRAPDSRTQSGDGGVESEAMSFSTACHGLAEDYADALLKLGIASRIHHDSVEDSWKTHVMGDSTEQFVDAVVDPADDRYEKAQAFAERSNATERHHDVLPPSAAEELRSLKRLLGVPLDGRFRPNVDEGYGVQISTVRDAVESLRGRAETVRSELDAVTLLSDARDVVGWSGRQLAERLPGITTSAVHYAENGGYTTQERNSMRTAAVDAISDALDTAERRLDDLESRCDLRYYRVTEVETVQNEGEDACEWVYDVTVEPTNTFVSGGVVLHNSISVSKAGINATLKSRCSLLGAANPKYGRFDQYEPIGEQIDLEPALISRFDLIFTVTDSPDPETDAKLADHIINTNYAGELHTQRTSVPNSEFTDDQVDDATADVTPEIEAELLRKYVAYAKRTCYPTMTDGAKEVIRQFYVDFRAKGADEDAPVPVTARKLEALVRLSEASARLRLSDTVEREDAVRVTEIVESCLRDIGMDPETGNFDADIVETGTSKSQRDRIKDLKHLIEELEDEYDEGAPVSEVVSRAGSDLGLEESKAETEIENLRRKGEVYEPRTDYLRTT